MTWKLAQLRLRWGDTGLSDPSLSLLYRETRWLFISSTADPAPPQLQ